MKPEEVKQLRKRLGYTQEQMAIRCGVGLLTVHNWEHGKHGIGGAALKILSEMDAREQRYPGNNDPLPEASVQEWAENRMLYGGPRTQRLARAVKNLIVERDRLLVQVEEFRTLRERLDS